MNSTNQQLTKFKEVIDHIRSKNSIFAAETCKIFRPIFLTEHKFRISVTGYENKKINLTIREDFFNESTIEELSFAVMHEIMHILRGDVLLDKKDFDYEKYKSNPTKLKKYVKYRTIARECIINDTLTSLYDFNLRESFSLDSGQDLLNTNTKDLTVKQVISLLLHYHPNLPDEEEHYQFGQNDGNELTETVKNLVEDYTSNNDLSQKDFKLVEDTQKRLKEHNVNININRRQSILTSSRDSLRWNKILFMLTDM
jgi:hypothetical protein